MKTNSFYPDLKIVPIADIRLQEEVQTARMQPLADAIKNEGVLRNPPIVTNFFNGTYLHLDGANRITAASLLGYPNCLVQIVDYSDPTHVHLTSWSHVTTVDKQQFLAAIKKIPDITVTEVQAFDHRAMLTPSIVCVMQFTDKTFYEVTVSSSFSNLVRCMGSIVNMYTGHNMERVFSVSPWTPESIHVRFERYPDHNVFIDFPTFSPQQIVSLATSGVLLPAGITRHVVYRRKLNVNVPLSYLATMPLSKANEDLQTLLQRKIVRLYEEPVIYFE